MAPWVHLVIAAHSESENPPAGSAGRHVMHLTRSGWFTPALPAYP